jgi:hypothetical protein
VPKLLEHCDQRFGQYKMLAIHHIWEDLFWKRKQQPVDWLEKLIWLWRAGSALCKPGQR